MTYLPKNLTSYVNAPEMWQFGTNFMIMIYLWCFRKESNIHIFLFRLIFTCMALFKILVCIAVLISLTRLRDSMSKHCVIETQRIIPSRSYLLETKKLAIWSVFFNKESTSALIWFQYCKLCGLNLSALWSFWDFFRITYVLT